MKGVTFNGIMSISSVRGLKKNELVHKCISKIHKYFILLYIITMHLQ